jgi:Yip1-like protein
MSSSDNQLPSDAPEYGASPVTTEPPAAPATPQEPARLGPAARLVGVLFSPGETFQDINRKPTWLVPILIGIVIALGTNLFFTWRVKPDWERIMRDQVNRQLERSGQPRPPDDQIDTQVRMMAGFAKFGPLFAIAIVPIYILILSGIFALGLMLIQAKTTFKKILSVVTWSSTATGLISAIVIMASLMARDQESLASLDPTQQGNLTATNLGVLLPADMSAPIRAVASSIDIFTIWFLILLSIGFAAIAGARNIKTAKTGTLVFGLWALWLVIRAGWAAMFGG